jgi:DNA polymerase III alpha subunit
MEIVKKPWRKVHEISYSYKNFINRFLNNRIEPPEYIIDVEISEGTKREMLKTIKEKYGK